MDENWRNSKYKSGIMRLVVKKGHLCISLEFVMMKSCTGNN